jgi:hypothetical protein
MVITTNKVFVPIIDSEKIDLMIFWCMDNISNQGDFWDWGYADDSDLNSDVYFYFVYEKDLTYFSLRWL